MIRNSKPETKIVHSVDEMHQLAAEIARQLNGGDVLALSGGLGAGKTTFVQGLARALGISNPIASPTFVLIKQYETARYFRLYHSDWYRLEEAGGIESLGLQEVMGDEDAVVVIEWPERAEHLLPEHTIRITFDYVDEQTRRVTIDR